MNDQATRIIQLSRMAGRENKLPSSKIISICSGKGGTGKSFFAANFAYALAKSGKKVLLIDFDLNFSNLNILLNKTTNDFLSEFFEKSKSLEELIFSYTNNLHIVFGDSGMEDHPHINNDEIDFLFLALDRLGSKYDYIILDSAAGANDVTLYQLSKSNINILLTSPEPTAIMDAYAVMKLLKKHESESNECVVVNKCASSEEAKNSFANLSAASKHFLSIEPNFLGGISFSNAIHQSIINQELYLKTTPQSRTAEEISSIIDRFESITTWLIMTKGAAQTL